MVGNAREWPSPLKPRKVLRDISNTPLSSARNDGLAVKVKSSDLEVSETAQENLALASTPNLLRAAKGDTDADDLVTRLQLTPRTPLQCKESLLPEDVQLTPPECKAMLNAINSAVDASNDRPGATEMPGSLEGWLQQVGIAEDVSETLKTQLQILYDRACESARLRSFIEAMKINELEMAAHEADDTARQMDMLAEENTFLFESKSSLMSDNELLRKQLQEAQARLESKIELLQVQQQQQQQQQAHDQPQLQARDKLDLGYSQAQQQQQQQQQQQLLQRESPACEERGLYTQLPSTPALLHTPAMVQAPNSARTPVWVTTRQGPCAPSPGLSGASIHTPSLEETEAWMQLDASIAARQALMPLETPSLQDALAWVDGPQQPQPALQPGSGFGSPMRAGAHPRTPGQLAHGPQWAQAPTPSSIPAPVTTDKAACATCSPQPAAPAPACTAVAAPGAGATEAAAKPPASAPWPAPSSCGGSPTTAAARSALAAALAHSTSAWPATASLHSPGAAIGGEAALLRAGGQGAASAIHQTPAAQGVLLGVTPTTHTAPTPHMPSTCEGSQISVVSRWSPDLVMFADWATAVGVAPGEDVTSRSPSQPSTVTTRGAGAARGTSSPLPPLPHTGASAGAPAAQQHAAPCDIPPADMQDSCRAAALSCPSQAIQLDLHVDAPAASPHAATPAMSPQAHPVVSAGALGLPRPGSAATSPGFVWAAAGSPSVRGSEISFGSCGAAGFTTAGTGSGARPLEPPSPAETALSAMHTDVAHGLTARGGGGGGDAAPPAAGAHNPRSFPGREAGQHEQRASSPAGVGVHQAAAEAQRTPCASAWFATPKEHAGSAAFQTPLSARATFHTGASMFASATRSVTSKPPASVVDAPHGLGAAAALFSTPGALNPLPTAAPAAAAGHASGQQPCLHHPPAAGAPPSPSDAPMQPPAAAPFAAAFELDFASAPPTCAKPVAVPAAAAAASPASLLASRAAAAAPTDMASPPFAPHHSLARSLGAAADRVGNEAWALLCSDDEEGDEGRGADGAGDGASVSPEVVGLGAGFQQPATAAVPETEVGQGGQPGEGGLQACTPAPAPHSATPLAGVPGAGRAVLQHPPQQLHTPSPGAPQVLATATSRPQVATYPLKPLTWPWGTQHGCKSAPPALQHGCPHGETTSSGGGGGGAGARFKPLCLTWCGAPSTHSRVVPGGPVRIYSTAASTLSALEASSHGVQALSCDAESAHAPLPSQAQLLGAAACPLAALEAGLATSELASCDSGTLPASDAQGQAQTISGICGPTAPAPTAHDAAAVVWSAPSNEWGGREGREVAAAAGNGCREPGLATPASVQVGVQGAEGDAVAGRGRSCDMMQVLHDQEHEHTGSRVVAAAAADVHKQEDACPAVEDCPVPKDQGHGTRRWRRCMTEEQEKEVRRRAAALQIHISPYFRGARSRPTPQNRE